MSIRIVIVGAGIAGIELATRLAARRAVRRAATVTLVDRSLSHYWKPMLHNFAAGTGRPERQKVDLLAHARASGFSFWPGFLTDVDRAAKQILLVPDPNLVPQAAAANRLDYDLLFLALGSRSNDFGTPGVAEHCLSIDDLASAERFRSCLRRELFSSILAGREMTIAIVGGGPTGVELAAELNHAVDLVSGSAEQTLRPRLHLTLIESGPRVLAAFPERIAQDTTRVLRELGIEVRTSTVVTGVDSSGLLLGDGARVDADLKVWAAGVRAPAVLEKIAGLERSRSGQLVVEPTLRTTRDQSIFALGDCSTVQHPNTGAGLPATAQVAHQQARHLGRHLDPSDPGRLPDFRYRDRGSLVALADYNGWGTVGHYSFGGGRLQGWIARIGHELLYRQHQLGIYGPGRAGVAWGVDSLDRLITPAVRLDV